MKMKGYKMFLQKIKPLALLALAAFCLAAPSQAVANVNIYDGASYYWDVQNGCYIENGQADAYDDGFTLSVNNERYSAAVSAQGTRGARCAAQTMSGLQVSRTVDALTATSGARFIDTFYNPTDAPITVLIESQTNLGSDGSTIIHSTASSDTTFDVGDTWLITDDSEDGGRDPTMLHYFWWSGGQAPSSASARQGNDGISLSWPLTVPAHATRQLLYIAVQNPNRAAADARAIELSRVGIAVLLEGFACTFEQADC